MAGKQRNEIASNSFYSKIKDGLYKVGDIIFMLLILVGMYFAITWKLNDVMPISVGELTGEVAVDESLPDDTSKSADEVINIDIDENDTENTDGEAEGSVDENSSENEELIEETELQAGEETNQEDGSAEAETVVPSNQITITVPAGSTSSEVSDILYDNKLISDKGIFLAKLKEMGLIEKVQAGEFNLRTDMSYEEIANIITGQQ